MEILYVLEGLQEIYLEKLFPGFLVYLNGFYVYIKFITNFNDRNKHFCFGNVYHGR